MGPQSWLQGATRRVVAGGTSLVLSVGGVSAVLAAGQPTGPLALGLGDPRGAHVRLATTTFVVHPGTPSAGGRYAAPRLLQTDSPDAPGHTGGTSLGVDPATGVQVVAYPNGELWQRYSQGRWRLVAARPSADRASRNIPAAPPTAPTATPPATPSAPPRPSTAVAPAVQPSLPALERALAATAGVVSVTPRHGGGYVVVTQRGIVTRQTLAALPMVASVDEPPTAQPTDVTLPSDYAASWQLGAVHAAQAWRTTRGQGQVIAVLDTGVTEIPDLAGTLWTNPQEPCGSTTDLDGDRKVGDCHGWNYLFNTPDLTNARSGDFFYNYHGTVVADAALGVVGNDLPGGGTAPAAQVMPLVVGDRANISYELAEQAIYYAVDHGATVINCSFGGSSMQGWQQAEWKLALAYAAAHNVLVVIAAGNNGGNNDSTPFYPSNIADPDTIRVAGTTAASKLASWSNYGATTVDVAAPGENTVVGWLNGGAVYKSGTSLASPIVAGVVALLQAAQPAATAPQIKKRLLDTVDKLPTLAGKVASNGMINAAAALDATPTPVTYEVLGVSTLRPTTAGTLDIELTAGGTPLPAGPLRLQVALGATRHGAMYAVTGLAVTSDGAAAATDDDGAVVLTPTALTGAGLQNGVDVPLNFALEQGQYVLMMQVADDAGVAIGRPHAVSFVVNENGMATPTSVPVPTAVPTPPTGPTAMPTAVPTGAPNPTTVPTLPGQPTAPAPAPAPTSSLAPTRIPAPAPTNPAPVPTTAPTTSRQPTTAPAPYVPTAKPTSTAPAPAPTTAPYVPAPVPTTAPYVPAPVPTHSYAPIPVPTYSYVPTPVPTAVPPTSAPQPSKVPTTPTFGITDIYPASGPSTGGSLVTISGTRLPNPAYVLVDGIPADNVQVHGSTMTFTTARHLPGLVSIQVFAQNNAVDTLTNVFRYNAVAGGPLPAPSTAPWPTAAPTNPAPAPTVAPTATARPTTPAPIPVPTFSAGPTAAPTNPAPAPTAENPGNFDAPQMIQQRGYQLHRTSTGPLAAVRGGDWLLLSCADSVCRAAGI